MGPCAGVIILAGHDLVNDGGIDDRIPGVPLLFVDGLLSEAYDYIPRLHPSP